MATEWTTLPVWSPDAKSRVHILQPSWFVEALPHEARLSGNGVIYHGHSKAEAVARFYQSPAYWLREKAAHRRGETFDLPVKALALEGLYVMDITLPEGEAYEEIQDGWNSEMDAIKHPLSEKLVRRGPFKSEVDAFDWRDTYAPDCVVCSCPSTSPV